jgi:hypothetical protein
VTPRCIRKKKRETAATWRCPVKQYSEVVQGGFAEVRKRIIAVRQGRLNSHRTAFLLGKVAKQGTGPYQLPDV